MTDRQLTLSADDFARLLAKFAQSADFTEQRDQKIYDTMLEAQRATPYRDCEGKIVLQMLVQTNDDTPHGIMDCLRTTDGTPYQSVHMKKLIEHARTLAGEVK